MTEIGTGIANENLEMIVVEHPVLTRPIRTGPYLVAGPDPGNVDGIISDGDSQVQKIGIPHSVCVGFVIVRPLEGSTHADLFAARLKCRWEHTAPLVQVAIDHYRPLGDPQVKGSHVRGQ